MGATGDSYLAAVCLMQTEEPKTQSNAKFQPKKAKNKDTEEISADYRFTAWEKQ